MMSSWANHSTVFICYSHKDAKFLNGLSENLAFYERNGLLDLWDDRRIKPGSEWLKEIEQAIASAKIAVLLISSSFLASQFIAEIELPLLLAASKKRGTIIMPVIVRPSNFEDTELSQFEAVNNPSMPLIKMRSYQKDELWAKVAREIKMAIVLQQPSNQQAQKQSRHHEDLREAPTIEPLYGRKAEYTKLAHWIINDRCRIVALLGMGGIGKTSLAARTVMQLKDTFEYVFWRSLKEAPPVEEILKKCSQFVTDQRQTDLLESVDEQIESLIEYLRKHRCLLVLDNVEGVLQDSNRTGKYRNGYEGYGRLIQLLGQREHQSILLLTSREKPKEVRYLESNTSPVRSLHLSGIGKAAGKKILKGQSKSVFGSDEAWKTLIQFYSGNPLALKLIAEPIQEVYGGDVNRFLKAEEFVFGDIRELLDQHFHRLSEREREIIYWLAIEREAVSLAGLQGAIVKPVSKGELPELLNILRRRSLIESDGIARFTLQPVIMEYVTNEFIKQVSEELDSETIRLFASHALIQAQAKDYIRSSQIRLILQPIAERLLTLGKERSEQKLKSILTIVREIYQQKPSYAGGNILNLLVQLQIDIHRYDFSYMVIRQAYLQGIILPEVNFAYANLDKSVFTETFGSIVTIKLDPGGNLLVAGTASGNIRFWQVPGEIALRTCEGHTEWVWSVAFSPDGKILASGSEDHSIRLWNASTGRCLNVLSGHSREVFSVTFSPNGKLLASGGNDCHIRLWDVSTGECLNILQEHIALVWSVAFSPDGSLLASGSHDQTVRLWDASTGQCLRILDEHESDLWSVAFSPDGKTLASSSGGNDQDPIIRNIRIWDVSTGQCLRVLNEPHSIHTVAFSPDGSLLASSSEDGLIRIWHASTYECLKTIQAHTSRIRCLTFSPDSSILMSGSDDQTIRIWDTSTYECLKIMQGHANRVRCIAFSPDGNILASDTDDQDILLWDLKTGQNLRRLQGHNDWIQSVTFSPNGTILASGGDDYTIRLWDVSTGQYLKNLEGHKTWIYSVDFSPNGSLLASSSEDHTIRLWDVKDGKCLKVLNEDAVQIWSVVFSPNGNILASGHEDHSVRLWDIKTGKCFKLFQEHTDRVRSVSFSPSGNILASGSEDHTIRLWDLKTGECFKILQGHTNRVFSIAFSADGMMLASGSEDKTVLLWNVNTNQCLPLQGHTSQARAVKFSPSGDILASGSFDGTIRLWDTQTRVCLKTLRSDQPYKGMNITGVKGLTEDQKKTLKALGAIDNGEY